MSQEFFATIQNKMHWAAHGHTAAEVIYERADAAKPQMGLTNWTGTTLRKTEAGIAKNYLSQKELQALNRIVSAYLEFAELQALDRNPMYMKDWIAKLNDFLKLSGRDILTNAGKISHQAALDKANAEYDKFHKERLAAPSAAESHFIEAEKELKQLEAKRKTRKGTGK